VPLFLPDASCNSIGGARRRAKRFSAFARLVDDGTRLEKGRDMRHLASFRLLPLLLLVGCADESSSSAESLLRVVPDAPAEACSAGGHTVLAGDDLDGDSVLDDDEVTAREVVCHDEPETHEVLSGARKEPAGANCPHGGLRVVLGADLDDDGVLDLNEIQHDTYLCRPAPAQLIQEEAEPAGLNCPGGGRAMHRGTDLDGDGVLDEDEIEDTAYICEIVHGDGHDGP
jgi:hypothetical protein